MTAILNKITLFDCSQNYNYIYMQLEQFTSKMHIPQEYKRVDNANLSLFVVFCIGIASYFSYWFVTNPDIPASETYIQTRPALVQERTQYDTNAQTIEASLIEVEKNETYIRVSTMDKGVYSIGLNQDTKISRDGDSISIKSLTPFERLSITIIDLPNTEKYDFTAKSILVLPRILPTQDEDKINTDLKSTTTNSQ